MASNIKTKKKTPPKKPLAKKPAGKTAASAKTVAKPAAKPAKLAKPIKKTVSAKQAPAKKTKVVAKPAVKTTVKAKAVQKTKVAAASATKKTKKVLPKKPVRKTNAGKVASKPRILENDLLENEKSIFDYATENGEIIAGDVIEDVTTEADSDVEDAEVLQVGELKIIEVPDPFTTFEELELHPELLAAVRKVGFTAPTLVQAMCMPLTSKGKDVAGFAQTGTGKTAVFLMTAAQHILNGKIKRGEPKHPSVLVLVPTRELASQISSDAQGLLSQLKINSVAIYGGSDMDKQVRQLEKGVEIVVATPGRLFDLHKQGAIKFNNVGLFVCDEADRMFDMGFIEDVEYVLRILPSENVQKLLFSATSSDRVRELAFEYLEQPEYVETNPEQIAPERITQWAYAVPADKKFKCLLGLVKQDNPTCALVFTNTKIVAEWVGYKLSKNGITAEVLTGDIPQRKRFSLINKIKNGEVHVLVATDVVSRGLHVPNLSHVYNFDIPDEPQNFIHRIGRTARAGAEGSAITLICEDYGYNMKAVEELLGFNLEVKPVPDSFMNLEDVSDSPFDSRGRVKQVGGDSERDERDEKFSEVRSPEAKAEAPKKPFREHKPVAENVSKEVAVNVKTPESVKTQSPTQQQPQPQNQEQQKHQQQKQPRNDQQRQGASQGDRPQHQNQPRQDRPQGDRPQHQNQPRQDRPQGDRPQQQERARDDRPNRPISQQPQQQGGNGFQSSVRRDERARDSVEGALAAAREAAERRRQNNHQSLQVKATPSDFVHKMKQGLVAAMDAVQDSLEKKAGIPFVDALSKGFNFFKRTKD